MDDVKEEAGGEGPPRGAGGGRGARYFAPQERVALLKGYQDSGLTRLEYGRRHGVSGTTLSAWQKVYWPCPGLVDNNPRRGVVGRRVTGCPGHDRHTRWSTGSRF